jgi:acyl-CoA reductase-like NAD-dependent aldehyde dehydrogenase
MSEIATAPVTGFKGSGWGSQNSHYGIGEWMFNKHVSLRPQNIRADAHQMNGQ